MKKLLLTVALVLAFVAGTASDASAFTGHHCTRKTCRFFTSSYSTAKYYYDRQTCSQWKSLDRSYRTGSARGVRCSTGSPVAKLHPPC